MASILFALSIASIVSSGAIFGFFYAWVCSTMWGLDLADPRIAISAMQAMNASVRNAVFFPAFFLTPVVSASVALVAFISDRRHAAVWFLASAVVYLVFGLLLTMMVNVPMNEALAALAVPESAEAAGQAWRVYSDPWQVWNAARAIASGLALVFAAMGLHRINQKEAD